MNKVAIIIILSTLILLMGCKNIDKDITIPIDSQPSIKIYRYCELDVYTIEYVDEMYLDNCYAVKNQPIEEYQKQEINQSFEYAELSAGRIWEIKNKNSLCRDFETSGHLYCLRNKTKCLLIEDNKICGLIELK